MWFILLVSVTATQAAHVTRNDSDVVVTYAGHSEAVHVIPKQNGNGTNRTDSGTSSTGKRVEYNDSDYLENRSSKNIPTEANPEVLFIPSGNNEDREYSRRTRVRPKEEVRLKDVVEKHTLGDIIHNRVVNVDTESPNEGILFISGKNNENHEQSIKQEEQVRRTNKAAKEFKKAAEAPLDCKNLNCDNNLASVCGVKIDQNKPKYRLFLNECYFRKVNCAFNYEINSTYQKARGCIMSKGILTMCSSFNRNFYLRGYPLSMTLDLKGYAMAPPEKCVSVGSHSPNRHGYSAFPAAMPPVAQRSRDQDLTLDSRRSNSRRALSTGLDGALCAHDCPVHCPQDYAPECGVSNALTRVFLNHCQMDLHSCTYGTMWQKRPIADCVGQQKADVHNNRAFIGWMQRIGLVDKKGKMITS